MRDIIFYVIALGVPLLMVILWLFHIIFDYKGTMKERLSIWYHESDGDI